MKKAFLLLSLLPSLATAQDTGLDLRVFDIDVTHQPPPWAAGISDPEQLQSLTKTQIVDAAVGDGSDLVGYRIVPEGDSFADPSQRFTILGQSKRAGTPQGYVNGEINKYAEACADAAQQELIQTDTRAMALLFCTRLNDAPEKGEIVVIDMNKLAGSDTLVMQFYHVWGPSYDISDQASWPASAEQVQAAIRSLTELALSPAGTVQD
ncbi:hypothetical protein KUW09_09330 [Mameliella alba]|nr:hypothetical protein [Antarctobacter heliothermus]MBY6144240.1 hypothetical protein [Mameliella alba]MCA0954289.1 hypothetical protein [Mameliella alba]